MNESGGLISTDASLCENAFMKVKWIKMTIFFYTLLKYGEVPQEVLVPITADEDAGHGMESHCTPTNFTEICKHEYLT